MTSTTVARPMRLQLILQLYAVALLFTLVPHLLAWAVPAYLARREAAAVVGMARDALVHGQLDDAVSAADAALSLDASSERARGLKASALVERYWASKDAADATAARAEVQPLERSRDAAVLVARGNLALADGDAAKAVELHTRAVGLAPDDAYARHQLGFSLGQLGRREESLASLVRALELEPDMAWAQVNIASALAELDRCDAAVAGLAPEHVAACHNQVGLTRYGASRYDDARSSFERAVRVEPTNGVYHANLAAAFLAGGDRSRAVQEALRARELGLDDHPVFRMLGARKPGQ